MKFLAHFNYVILFWTIFGVPHFIFNAIFQDTLILQLGKKYIVVKYKQLTVVTKN